MDGPNTIFNLDRNQSILCMGSCPSDMLQSGITENGFEGEIEDVKIGDLPLSLWNFKMAEHNEGAIERYFQSYI